MVIILKMALNRVWTVFVWLRRGSSNQGSYVLVYTRSEEILDYLRTCQIIKD
jgi:hypothetical protein